MNSQKNAKPYTVVRVDGESRIEVGKFKNEFYAEKFAADHSLWWAERGGKANQRFLILFEGAVIGGTCALAEQCSDLTEQETHLPALPKPKTDPVVNAKTETIKTNTPAPTVKPVPSTSNRKPNLGRRLDRDTGKPRTSPTTRVSQTKGSN